MKQGLTPHHFRSSVRVLPRPSYWVGAARQPALSCLSLTHAATPSQLLCVFILTLAAYPLFQQRTIVSFLALKVVWTQTSNSIPYFHSVPHPSFVPPPMVTQALGQMLILSVAVYKKDLAHTLCSFCCSREVLFNIHRSHQLPPLPLTLTYSISFLVLKLCMGEKMSSIPKAANSQGLQCSEVFQRYSLTLVPACFTSALSLLGVSSAHLEIRSLPTFGADLQSDFGFVLFFLSLPKFTL